MISNKIKLFLLLTFGFVFLFSQNSLAQTIEGTGYINEGTGPTGVTGAIPANCNVKGDYTRPTGNLTNPNQMCTITSDDLTKLNQITNLGLNINEIKIPYKLYSQLRADNNKGLNDIVLNPLVNRAEWGVSSCNSNGYDGIGKLRGVDCGGTFGSADYDNKHYETSATQSFISLGQLDYTLQTPITYNAIKNSILRSCFRGSITTTPGNINTFYCAYSYTKNCGGSKGKMYPVTSVVSNYRRTNFPSWSTLGCDSLINAMDLTIKDERGGIISPNETGRIVVNDYGAGFATFSLAFTSSNPSANCELSGVDASSNETPKKTIAETLCSDNSSTCRTKINNGEVNLDGSGRGIKKEKSLTFSGVSKGIYTYIFKCTGTLNGKESTKQGTETITKKVFVGADIPPDPAIDFNLVMPNEKLMPAPEGASYQYSIFLNDNFQFKWNVTNLNNLKNTDTVPIVIKHKDLTSGQISTLTSSKETISQTSPIKLSTLGVHEFYLEASNTDYPDLTATSPSIKIRVKLATTSNVVDVSFSAASTTINKGESTELSWDASDAAKVTIDQGIGDVQKVSSVTVSPAETTTYTLTATSPIVNTPTTKKIVIVSVRGTEENPIEIKPFEIATSTATTLPEQEGKPSAQIIDLKVNGTDGPITLAAPAKFVLSWNLDTYCLATGSWLDIKTKAGSQSISLSKNGKYTYSLYCPGYGTDSVIVEVVNSNISGLANAAINAISGGSNQTTNMPAAEASVSTDFTNYSQNISVIRGVPTTIFIKVDKDINNDGQISHDATNQWSQLLSNGGYCLYNNDLIKGTPSFNGMIASPADAQSCNTTLGTFTFNDEPGTYQYGIFRLLQNDKKLSNISYITITVENPPAPTSGPIINLNINGNDAAEQILGTPANFTLYWNASNATNCEASGDSWSGTKDLSGVQSFVSSSKKDFNFTLTCTGELGTTSKSIALKVVETPICSFTAMPPSINKTSAFVTDSELSWKCDYADSCTLSPEVLTQVKTYGSARVSPNQTTNYALTCSNSSVSATFETIVEVK